MEERQQPSLLIVDSFALLFRGFFSTASVGNYMRTREGLCTNGIYQFTRYLFHAIQRFAPSHVVCTFDMGKKTFRNEMYPLYKAQRDAPPEELIPQFDKLWELVEAFDIPCIGQVGYEADDLYGSISKHYSDQGMQVRILTGDGDSLQLINENTQIVMLKKGFGNYEVISHLNLEENKGVQLPSQIIELKGLMGDTSDNIPGCPGIGPKTALKLILEYGTIDNIYAHIDDLKGKMKERLIAYKEQVYLSHDLATIRTNIPFECSLDACELAFDRAKVLRKMEEFEFSERLTKAFAG